MNTRHRLTLMGLAFAAGMALLATLALRASSAVEVNGPVYARIAQQKDLVADILPPPAYAIEAYLAAHQLLEQADRRAGAERIAALAADFETRHTFWAGSLPRGPAAEAAARAHRTGTAFLEQLQREVVKPAVAGDDQAAEQALRRAAASYQTHRDAIDTLSRLALDASTAAEAEARDAVAANLWKVVALAVLVTLAVGLMTLWISRRVEGSMRGLAGELTGLTAAADRGDLRHRADPAAVDAEFRPLVEGVNRTVEALVAPIDLAADHVARIGRGDLPPPITAQYRGEFAVITGSLNGCVAALSGLVGELHAMAAAHAAGRISTRIDAGRFEGVYGEVASGVNGMVAALQGDVGTVLHAFDEFGRGNFAVAMPALPGEKAAFTAAVEQVRGNLDGFIVAMRRLAAEQEAGDVDAAIDAGRFQGDWRAMAEGVNGMAARHLRLTRALLACVDGFGAGRFDVPLERLPGKLAAINETVERVRGSLLAVIEDAGALTAAARQGRLTVRADPARHQGDFQRIVAGLNDIFDALDAPIQEASRVLSRMAARDITARIQVRFEGDNQRLVEAVNATAGALADALGQVTEAVLQVSTAADEISSASHSVAQGASAQAAEVERIRAQLHGIGELTRGAAVQADRADVLSRQSTQLAASGTTVMAGLDQAMQQIRSSAQRTSQIIRDINDIAFQTNLLALNAAVEAARAGDAGRGFAVVAEEVRTLARRCKEAAQRTEGLIQESVRHAGDGEETARAVARMLGDISGQVAETAQVVGAIAGASREQTTTIGSLEAAVGEVDRVMQQTAASAGESSSAALELNGQAEELGAMIGTFRLREHQAEAAAGYLKKTRVTPTKSGRSTAPLQAM